MKNLNILITNDDGIDAEGIKRLAETARELGQIWVVAPDSQRSAMSHSITLRHTIDVFPHDIGVEEVHAFACTGTPADCVRVGGLNVMPVRPDVVLSGINYGYNVASDIQYSATAGAAFEGSFQGWHSIALSEGMCEMHQVTDHYLMPLLKEALEMETKEGEIVNINFPECPLADCKGVLRDRRVSRSMFFKDSYSEEALENGGIRYNVCGTHTPFAEEGTDYKAILDNYVSIGIATNIC